MQIIAYLSHTVPHCPTFGTRDTFGFRYDNVLKTSTSGFGKSVPLENRPSKHKSGIIHKAKIMTRIAEKLLILSERMKHFDASDVYKM